MDGPTGERWFADLSDRRFAVVRGDDAEGWLNDLLTADMTGLVPGEARRTLLLTATGRIRADLAATSFEGSILLIQDPTQPDAIDRLLDPYVLSSDVTLEDRSDALALFGFSTPAPAVHGAVILRPSTIGAGEDLLASAGRADDIRAAAADAGFAAIDPAGLDAVRIRRGVPRFPIDLTGDSLPHEVPLDAAIDFGKGCYLGQEAVAKVRNLGHPPFVLLAAEVDGLARAGDDVVSNGQPAGTVTSAIRTEAGTAAIVRVRWASREGPLSLADGASLRTRASAAS